MKKLSFLLAVVMLLGVSPVLASDNMREVLTAVKERVVIPDDCTEFSGSTGTYDGVTTYNFHWSTPGDGESWKSVDVSATPGKVITSLYTYSESDYTYKQGKIIPLITKEQALSAASDYFRTVNPQIADEFDFSGAYVDLSYREYSIQAPRMANGIKTTDTAHVSVDCQSGKVSGFSLQYTEDAVFPSIESILSPEEAKEKFSSGAIKKIYTTLSDEKKAVIVFASSELSAIDAVTGEQIEFTPYDIYRYANISAAMGKEAADSSVALTPAELAEVDAVEGLLSAAELEKRLLAMTELSIGDAPLTGAHLSKRGGKYYMGLSFESENAYTYADMNAETGELYSFYGYSYNAKQGERVIDDSFVQKYFSGYLADMALASDGSRVRTANGLEFPQNYIRAYKDADTGKIVEFSMQFDSDIEFAPVAETISYEQAYAALYELAEPEIKYVWTENKKEAVAAYLLSFEYFTYLDGITGNAIDSMGTAQPKPEDAPFAYSDIEGHYAQNAITSLASIGAGFEGGAFLPENVITQQEYAALVSKCILEHEIYAGGKMDAAATAQYMIRRGFIKEDEYYPNEPLTREMAVTILLKAMGYENFASIAGIFKVDYTDAEQIDPSLLGYVAIASGLNIVGGSGGLFSPKDNLTRAQAAVIIYNYLK